MQKGEVRSIAMVIIFSFITCGLYSLYWLYVTTDEVKQYLNDSTIDPSIDLILTIITCGLYTFYWYYKISKLITQCQKISNLPIEDNSLLYIILALFGFGIISNCIIQSQLNTIWNQG